MTPDQFRSSADLTARYRELLNDAVFDQAFVLADAAGRSVDAPLGSNETHSVRILSQSAGWAAALQFLRILAEPLAPEPGGEHETWEPPEPPPEPTV